MFSEIYVLFALHLSNREKALKSGEICLTFSKFVYPAPVLLIWFVAICIHLCMVIYQAIKKSRDTIIATIVLTLYTIQSLLNSMEIFVDFLIQKYCLLLKFLYYFLYSTVDLYQHQKKMNELFKNTKTKGSSTS